MLSNEVLYSMMISSDDLDTCSSLASLMTDKDLVRLAWKEKCDEELGIELNEDEDFEFVYKEICCYKLVNKEGYKEILPLFYEDSNENQIRVLKSNIVPENVKVDLIQVGRILKEPFKTVNEIKVNGEVLAYVFNNNSKDFVGKVMTILFDRVNGKEFFHFLWYLYQCLFYEAGLFFRIAKLALPWCKKLRKVDRNEFAYLEMISQVLYEIPDSLKEENLFVAKEYENLYKSWKKRIL